MGEGEEDGARRGPGERGEGIAPAAANPCKNTEARQTTNPGDWKHDLGKDPRTVRPFRLWHIVYTAGRCRPQFLVLSISSKYNKILIESMAFPLYLRPGSKNMEPAPAFLRNQLAAFRGPGRAQKADPRKVATIGRE